MTQPGQYRMRPTTVTALQWTGANTDDIRAFVGTRPDGASRFALPNDPGGPFYVPSLWDDTTGGWNPVNPGDYIVQDATNQYHPVGSSVFPAIYTPTGP
jgi:hypothetical protein